MNALEQRFQMCTKLQSTFLLLAGSRKDWYWQRVGPVLTMIIWSHSVSLTPLGHTKTVCALNTSHRRTSAAMVQRLLSLGNQLWRVRRVKKPDILMAMGHTCHLPGLVGLCLSKSLFCTSFCETGRLKATIHVPLSSFS